MIEILQGMSSSLKHLHNKEPSINGFCFEFDFFKCCQQEKELVVAGCKVSDPATTAFSFCVQSVVALPPTVSSLTSGILYELRAQHPAIDGVGVLRENHTNEDWLVLVQVSLSAYNKQHSSKMSDILNKPKSTLPELSSTSIEGAKSTVQLNSKLTLECVSLASTQKVSNITRKIVASARTRLANQLLSMLV